MTHRTTAFLRLAGCLVAELAVLVLLTGDHVGRAGTPPLGPSITDWWAAQDPLDAAAGVGAVIGVVVATYLVAVTSLHLVAVATRGRRLGRMATRLGPRFLAGLAATAVLGSGSAMASTADGPTPSGSGAVMELVDATPSRTWLPWADGAAPTAVQVGAATSVEAPGVQVPDPPPPPPPTNAAREVTVRRGDSMWTIARDELASRLARTPTVAEIDPYWRDLIELNRSRLVDPTNPSLIYPDQTFELP